MAIKKLDSASFYLGLNINHPEIDQNRVALIKTYRRYVRLESIKNNNIESLKYINKTLLLVNKESSDYLILIYYKAVAYNKLKNYKKSNAVLNTIPYKKIKTFIELRKEYHKFKFKNFSALKKHDSVTFHIESLMSIKDSMYNFNYLNITKKLQTKYQTQQKENQILKLSNENIKKEAETKRKKTQLNYSLFGGASILLLSLFTFRAYRKEKKTKEQVLVQKQEIEVLHKELHHRVKNNLGIAKSFIKVAKKNLSSAQEQHILNSLQNRMASISDIHELLYKQESVSEVDFQRYADLICEEISKTFNKENNISYAINANIQLPIKQATLLGLILNEAVTNTHKYAFLSQEQGIIEINIEKKNNTIFL